MPPKPCWRPRRDIHSLQIYSRNPQRGFSNTVRLSQTPQPPPQPDAPSTTHFGFQTLPSSEKASRVGQVFTSVAPSYDTMNDLMSLGIHRLWKDYFVRSINPGHTASPTSSPHPPQKILDVAGGTGDIALRMLQHAERVNGDTDCEVIISDINPDMLAEGRRRMAQTGYRTLGEEEEKKKKKKKSRISFLEADAQSFPTIPPASIDLYTISFGIRNVTSIPLALRTALRILKPGGVFACLEFCPRLRSPLLNSAYKRWSFGAIPLIGQLVAGDRGSYQYLVESIERFPEQAVFEGMIREAGFEIPGGKGWVDLTGGVAAVHKGVKPL